MNHQAETLPAGNRHLGIKLIGAANALSALNDMGVEVLEANLTLAVPVLHVRSSAKLKAIGGSWAQTRTNANRDRVKTMCAILAGCRIEWEINQ
ncbi:hypothetical protein [Oceanobacter kriegii]|uniref:hypothetical protein n=1 Tax=Oceanobacter kriegii TaxID=64972 RepID=UPI00040C6503|nr:hypothetical protein [Oceanobacter kriegii]